MGRWGRRADAPCDLWRSATTQCKHQCRFVGLALHWNRADSTQRLILQLAPVSPPAAAFDSRSCSRASITKTITQTGGTGASGVGRGTKRERGECGKRERGGWGGRGEKQRSRRIFRRLFLGRALCKSGVCVFQFLLCVFVCLCLLLTVYVSVCVCVPVCVYAHSDIVLF